LHLGHFPEGQNIQSTLFVTVHKCAHIIECYYCNQCSLSYFLQNSLFVCLHWSC